MLRINLIIFWRHLMLHLQKIQKNLLKGFPYIFPYHDRTSLPERVYSVVITLTKQDRDDLRIYANARSQYINSAARNIIQEKLKSIKK